MPVDAQFAQFENLLRSTDPLGALRKLAQQLLDEGLTPEAVLSQFEQIRQVLRDSDREKDEDAVMDVMEFLTGWCSPHMKLPAEKMPGEAGLSS